MEKDSASSPTLFDYLLGHQTPIIYPVPESAYAINHLLDDQTPITYPIPEPSDGDPGCVQ